MSSDSVLCRTVPSEFQSLLIHAATQFPSQHAMADAIGISPARLNRAIHQGDYAFNVANCLRLALVTSITPSTILRAAGKGEIADLIERLYGSVDPALTRPERDHLRQWRALEPDRQAAIAVLMREHRTRHARR
jgi:hypothetical protein